MVETALILGYLVMFGAIIIALFLVASVWALIYWVRDTIHYKSIHHSIETRRHRA